MISIFKFLKKARFPSKSVIWYSVKYLVQSFSIKATKMSEQDSKIVESVIEKEKDFLNTVSQKIWKRPELSFEEIYAHDILTDALTKHGFKVKKNYLLPTAFRAEFASDDGPSIAILLEYDALPDIGHACGHNLIAEAGLAAAIGIKAAMENDLNLKGRVVILGTPGEESGGGKIKLMKLGAFNDIDAAIMVHPFMADIFNFPSISSLPVSVKFIGKESHAGAFPWEGINALDAAVNLYQSLGLLRQQLKPSYRLHAIITKGGTVTNIIPAETRVDICCRTPMKTDVLMMRQKLENCIKGAAMSTGCTYEANFDEENMYFDLVANKTMLGLFTKYFETPETDTSKFGDMSVGSTDMGNVSYILPSIHPLYSINTRAMNHTKKFTEASGSEKAQLPTLKAAKAMALTVLSLMRYPEKMALVKEEFKREVLRDSSV